MLKPNFGVDLDFANKIVRNKAKEKNMNFYKHSTSINNQILDPGDAAVENENNTWDEDLKITQVSIEGNKSDDDISRGYDKTINFADFYKNTASPTNSYILPQSLTKRDIRKQRDCR